MSTGEQVIPDVGKIAIIPISSIQSRKKTPFHSEHLRDHRHSKKSDSSK